MSDVTTEDGVVHHFPPGTTPAMIKVALAKYMKPASPQGPPQTAFGQVMPQQRLQQAGEAISQGAEALGKGALNLLPTIGGGLGGFVGGTSGGAFGLGVGAVPGSIGGAGLGAAGGEAAKQLIERSLGMAAPESGAEAAGRIGVQGVIGAAGEGAGLGIANVAGRVARPIMAKALRPAKEVMANFRNVVEDAITNRVPVGTFLGMGAPGSARATMLARQASDNVRQILGQAAGRGIMIDRHELAQPMIEAVETRLGRALDPGEYAHIVRAVSRRAGELLTQATAGIRRHAIQGGPVLINEVRQLARDEAKAAIKGAALRLPPSAIPDMDLMLERGARQALNRRVTAQSMGSADLAYQPAQETAARAMGVERAVNNAELNPAASNVGLGAAGFHVGIGVPPPLASRLALLMSDPRVAPLLSTLLRTTGSLGTQAMTPQQAANPQQQ